MVIKMKTVIYVNGNNFNKKKSVGDLIIGILLLIISFINTMKDILNIESEKQKAILSNQAKGNFLANMSHEIRTPMNAICGMVELLIQNGAATGSNGEYINTIKIASNSLLGIINDILDFSKIEAGKIETIDINYNFSSSVNDVINIINTKINHEKVAFCWDCFNGACLYNGSMQSKIRKYRWNR